MPDCSDPGSKAPSLFSSLARPPAPVDSPLRLSCPAWGVTRGPVRLALTGAPGVKEFLATWLEPRVNRTS
jgi:hypothetical protein